MALVGGAWPACANEIAYVRARAADAAGQAQIAAIGYSVALDTAPTNVVIAGRALREAMLAGDLVLARRAAGILRQARVAVPDAAVLMTADAVRARKPAGVSAAVETMSAGPLGFLAPIIRAWAVFDAGGDALGVLRAEKPSPLSRRFVLEHLALLRIAGGDVDGGLADVRALIAAEEDAFDVRRNAAQLLAGMGRRADAVALLEGDDPALAAMRARIGRGAKAGAAFGISRLFARLAGDLNRSGGMPLAVTLTRSALILDPGDDRARVLLGDALIREKAYGEALQMLAGIKRSSAFADAGHAGQVKALTEAGRTDEALVLAGTLARRRGASAADAARYADLLIDEGQLLAAAEAYGWAIERTEQPRWLLYLQRGGALEQAGRWDAAEPDLERAVAMAPNQPVALNYLGYARVERGEDIAASIALLERAHRLRPDDMSIADSLGWAYFRKGDAARALPLLEQAAQGQPSDVTINEHLGDVYWAIGRRFEARYAWRAAAVHAVGGDEKQRIADKIARGLDARVAAN